MNAARLALILVLFAVAPVSAEQFDRRVFTWNPKQWSLIDEMLQPKHTYVDVEGGIRAGKTTPLVHGTAQVAIQYPGINQRLARWTDDALDTQLKPAWREAAHQIGLDFRWNAEEGCDEVYVGGAISRVYLRGLKPGEGAQRWGKIRGKTLARIGIDQAEELPLDFWLELQGRLSQPGYPHQIVITPQPVMPDHWIAKEFPLDNSNPDHLYIRTNAYDNRRVLGDAYLARLEAAYPEGTAQRRTLLMGERGLAMHGDPVYRGYFSRSKHVDESVRMNARVPLLEAWDFGHGHPCVTWAQFLPTGGFQILGGVMGENMYLPDFVPIALSYRARWCPKPMEVLSCGDPAGLMASNQGLPQTVEGILGEHGVYITTVSTSNMPEVRDQAIQTIAGYMRRDRVDGRPAFLISPRAVVVNAQGERVDNFLVDGFEAGYVWDTRSWTGTRANVRRPKKDGYFDHGQNCTEYQVLNFGPGLGTQQTEEELEREAVRRAQHDEDPADARLGRSGQRSQWGRRA